MFGTLSSRYLGIGVGGGGDKSIDKSRRQWDPTNSGLKQNTRRSYNWIEENLANI